MVKDVQEATQEYDSVYVFRVQNMRISGLNELRKKFRGSKVFLGKNKVVALALGKKPESEIFQNVHKISERLQVRIVALAYPLLFKAYTLSWDRGIF